jgi:hypothetical protein
MEVEISLQTDEAQIESCNVPKGIVKPALYS